MQDNEEWATVGRESSEPRFPTWLAYQPTSERQDPKSNGRGHPHFYLSCACTKGDVYTLMDVTPFLVPMSCEGGSTSFHPSLPGPWAQLWPGKGGGHREGRPCLSFSLYVLIVHTFQILGS